MGKFVSTAILAVVALAFVNCHKDKKEKTPNIAKNIAREYSITADGQTFKKFNIVEVTPTVVKFALDSMRLDSVTAISVKEINQVKVTLKGDSVLLAADATVQATVYTVKTVDGKKTTTPETKSVQVKVTGNVVGRKLDLEIAFPKLLEKPTSIKIDGLSK
jgi:hypothetical protein